MLHALRAVQEIFCSGGSGLSLPALRASAYAHGSCLSVPASDKKLIMQEASDLEFLLRRGGACRGLVLVVGGHLVLLRARAVN